MWTDVTSEVPQTSPISHPPPEPGTRRLEAPHLPHPCQNLHSWSPVPHSHVPLHFWSPGFRGRGNGATRFPVTLRGAVGQQRQSGQECTHWQWNHSPHSITLWWGWIQIATFPCHAPWPENMQLHLATEILKYSSQDHSRRLRVSLWLRCLIFEVLQSAGALYSASNVMSVPSPLKCFSGLKSSWSKWTKKAGPSESSRECFISRENDDRAGVGNLWPTWAKLLQIWAELFQAPTGKKLPTPTIGDIFLEDSSFKSIVRNAVAAHLLILWRREGGKVECW